MVSRGVAGVAFVGPQLLTSRPQQHVTTDRAQGMGGSNRLPHTAPSISLGQLKMVYCAGVNVCPRSTRSPLALSAESVFW